MAVEIRVAATRTFFRGRLRAEIINLAAENVRVTVPTAQPGDGAFFAIPIGGYISEEPIQQKPHWTYREAYRPCTILVGETGTG
jgi:hypothetical protein